MRARLLALPVHRRPMVRPVAGRLLSVGGAAAYLDAGGFVVALTAPGVPLMPNAIVLDDPPDRLLPSAGSALVLRRGALEAAGRPLVTWDAADPLLWDPLVMSPPGADAAQSLVAAAAADLVATQSPPDAVAAVVRAVASRDREQAAAAAELLTGRGPGLTPEGDDLLAGVAVTVAVFGAAAGFDGEPRRAWLRALCAPAERGRTTALAATLLRLAAAGQVAEPVHAFLAAASSGARTAALARLQAIGGSSGAAYVTGIVAAAGGLARGVDLRRREWRATPLAAAAGRT